MKVSKEITQAQADRLIGISDIILGWVNDYGTLNTEEVMAAFGITRLEMIQALNFMRACGLDQEV